METLTDRPPARADPPPRPSAHRRPVRRRRSEWRLLAFGMLVSVLVHGLVVAVASRVLFVPDPAGSPASPAPTRAPVEDVMRGVDIIEVASADAPEPVPPEPREDEAPALEPAPERVAPPAAEADAGADETAEPRPMSAAERLRPRMGDRRLWTSPSELAPPSRPTDMERARTRIAGKVGVLNDSIAAVMEAERRSREWTVEDEDGGRWGISPGKLHLGDITIPLPIEFPLSPRMRERIGEWSAIRNQAARESAREYRERRAEVIRERKEQERDSTQSGTGGDGGPDRSPPR